MNVSTPIRRAIGAISCDRREVHVVLGAGRDAVRVDAVGVERDGVLVRQQAVLRQIAVELPRLVAVACRPKPVKTAGSASGSPGRTMRTRPGPGPGFSMWACSSNGPRLRTSREKSTTALPAAAVVARRARRAGRCAPCTMNALRVAVRRARATRRARQRLPGAGRVRLAPGARVRVADRERRSRPVRLAPVARRRGRHGSSASRRPPARPRRASPATSTSGTDDSITVCVRKPATPGYASAMRVTDRPGSRSGAASRIVTRRPPRASFVTLTEWTVNALAAQLEPAEREREVARAAAPRRGPRRAGRPAPPSGTAPASSGGWPARCSARSTSARRRRGPARRGRSPHSRRGRRASASATRRGQRTPQG